MNPQLIAQVLLAIAGAARSPGIGHDSIARWIELAGRLIETGSAAEAELRALKAQVEQMVIESREPTRAEWAAWEARSDAASDSIQSWRPGS